MTNTTAAAATFTEAINGPAWNRVSESTLENILDADPLGSLEGIAPERIAAALAVAEDGELEHAAAGWGLAEIDAFIAEFA
ncbi:MAG TPA: hypothetical protein VMW08_01020 [Acidimicrobiales bacterium]|nr:hypothetical protein [Acidimicrobiales bacterium]